MRNSDNTEAVKRPINYGPRIAFCSLLAIGGASLVIKGDDLQGFIWWFLLVFILGTLLEGSVEYDSKQRIKFSAVVALSFLLALIGLFLLTGVGPSSYIPEQHTLGVDFSKIPARAALLINPLVGGVFLSIGTVTLIAIYIASLASSHTLVVLEEWISISEKDVNAFKSKYRVTVSVIVGIVSMVAYFSWQE